MQPDTHRPATSPRPVTLSETERRFLHALQQMPRASWVDLARRAGIDRDIAAARWNALIEARVAWQAAYPGPRWWRTHQLVWVEQDVPQADLDAVVAELSAIGRVLSLDVDLDSSVLAAVATRDYQAAGRPLLDHLTPARETHLATELYSNASRWRIGALPDTGHTSGGPPIAAPGTGPSDDRIRALLAALGPDPRRPITDIAAVCQVSYMTASRWLAHALAGGDLGIRVELTPETAGHPVALHWWLRVPDAHHTNLVDALLAQSDVRWVAGVLSTTGATVLAAAWTCDLPAARRLTARVAGRCPAAITVRQVVTRRSVKRLGWLLDPDGRRGDYVPLEI